jgi:thiamine-phosphate pyrophosphorylase
VGPIFTTPTKPDAGEGLGIMILQEIKKFSNHPLIAIGGINLNNVHEVMKMGADGIAVVSAICGTRAPKQAAVALKAECLRSLQ